MFTNGKTYIIFYSSGAHFLFFLLFLSHFRFFHLSFLLWVNHFSALSLLLLDVFASLSNEAHARASSQGDLYHNGFFFWWFDGRFGSGCVGYGFGVLDRGLMCSSNFMGLSSWVWVCGSSMWPAWIVELIGVDRQLDWSHQHGSSTWLAWVSDRFGGCWNCGG